MSPSGESSPGLNRPLQKSFAALMIGYAQGDVILGAAALGREYGVALRSVSDYAAGVRAQRAAV